jgi:hypothetical protein
MAIINNPNEVLHRIRAKLYLHNVDGAFIARTDDEAAYRPRAKDEGGRTFGRERSRKNYRDCAGAGGGAEEGSGSDAVYRVGFGRSENPANNTRRGDLDGCLTGPTRAEAVRQQ